MKDTKQIAILCFLADLGLSIWSYFQLTDYDEYLKSAKLVTDSPDLQIEFYQLMLQSFTFTLLLFLIFHLVIYFMMWKQKVYAIKYVRFYTFMAALSAILMIISLKNFVLLIPLIVYALSFKALGNWRKQLQATKI